MATTYTDKSVLRMETTGSVVEAAGGVAVIVLSIIGLSRTDAGMLPSIAVIIMGAALLAEGGAIATEFTRLLNMTGDTTINAIEIGGGMTTEIVIGAGVLVLGVLALVGLSPATLISVTVIATGGLLLIAAPGIQRLNEVRLATSGASESTQKLVQAAGAGAAGVQVLAALAAIVLGILSLTSPGTAVTGTASNYALVGLLVLGASITLSATALTGNMIRLFNR